MTNKVSDAMIEAATFERDTMRHNIKEILRSGRDIHPDTMLDRIMAAIPVRAMKAQEAADRPDAAQLIANCAFEAMEAADQSPAEVERVRSAIELTLAMHKRARDLVPDEEEGLAAQIFCHHINHADGPLIEALAALSAIKGQQSTVDEGVMKGRVVEPEDWHSNTCAGTATRGTIRNGDAGVREEAEFPLIPEQLSLKLLSVTLINAGLVDYVDPIRRALLAMDAKMRPNR